MKNLSDEANSRVSIFLVCGWIGVDVEAKDWGSSIKTYCPFGDFFHSDRGKEPAFRVYADTNSAYCFSCKKYFSPVSLYAAARDMTNKEAAETLLEKVGYKPPSAKGLWEEVRPKEAEPDTSMLNKALRTYCQRICPTWNKKQFEPGVAEILGKCLELLDVVKTMQDSDKWLKVSKEVMRRTLTKEQP